MISYLDTNVVIWLEAGMIDRLSPRAQDQIESCDLLISPIVLLELELLHEIGKLLVTPDRVLADLHQQIGLTVCQLPMSAVVMSAGAVKWTREPWDRMIVGNAIANNMTPLVTADRTIRLQYPHAIW